MKRRISAPHVNQGWYWRWGAVLAGVGTAFFLRTVITQWYPGLGPFMTFYPAVLVAALLAGLWAGIAATALSGLLALYFIFEPVGTLASKSPANLINLAVFSVFGICLSAVVERHLRNREKLAVLDKESAIADERKEAEKDREIAAVVQNERNRLFEILETLPAMTTLLTPNHTVVFANRMFRERYGEANGRPCYDLRFRQSTPCDFCESFVPLKTGTMQRWELHDRSGSIFQVHSLPFRDFDGSDLILEMDVDITESRRAQTALSELNQSLEIRIVERTKELSETTERLRALMEAAPVGISFSADTTCRHITGNRAMLDQFEGQASENLSASSLNESDPGRRIGFVRQGKPITAAELPLQRAVAENRAIPPMEFEVLLPSGRRWLCEGLGAPVRDAGGKVIGGLAVTADITQRKQAEIDLAKARAEAERSAAQLRTIFESVKERLYVCDGEGNPVMANQASRETYSRSDGSIPSVLEMEKDLETFDLAGRVFPLEQWPISRVRRGERISCVEVLVKFRSTGQERILSCSGSAIRDGTGKVILAVLTSADVTEHKKAEEQLRKLNRVLKALRRSDQAILRAADEEDFLREVCRIIVEECGHTMVWIGFAEHDERQSVRIVAHAGFDAGYLENLQLTWSEGVRGRGPTGRSIRSGKPEICHDMLTDPAFAPWREEATRRGYASSISIPFRRIHHDWGTITIYSQERDAFSPGEVNLLTELARDVEFGVQTLGIRAAHARAEQELIRSREMLGLFIEEAPVAMAMFDKGMCYLHASRQWKSDYGFGDRALTGLSHYDLYPEIPKEWRSAYRSGLAGQSLSSDGDLFRRADGLQRWIRWEIRPWYETGGEVGGIVILTEDITERRAAEAALRESERLSYQREQLKALTERLQMAREEERTRVARDLHDEIGQILTAVKMDLMWIGRRVNSQESDVSRRLEGAIELVNEGVKSVRRICTGLRPAVLDDLGLAAAIEWQANEFSTRTGIACRVSLPPVAPDLTTGYATTFFRIFQECLTNVSRHAAAQAVDVSLATDGDDLVLIVKDDGKGFPRGPDVASLGILGMKERAEFCGGQLTIASAAGEGTTVTLRVPARFGRSNEDDNACSDRG